MSVIDYREPETSIRNAQGDARNSIAVMTDYETLCDATGDEYDFETIYSDRSMDYADLRVFTSGESATLHFFPKEELRDEELIYGLRNDDAEIRKDYQEDLEFMSELVGSDEELGRLLEQVS